MAKKKKVVGTPFGQAQAAPKASASPNEEARRATESYASPFSTAFGGSAPSTELDAARQYASPFSTAFGGTAPTFESEAPSESPIVNKEVDEEDEPEVLQRRLQQDQKNLEQLMVLYLKAKIHTTLIRIC
jgi:hypothetical protein